MFDDPAPLSAGVPPLPGDPVSPPLGMGPYGPPGPPGPGGPGGYGPSRPRRKSNQGLLIGGIAGGVLALVLVAALIVMVASDSGGGPVSGDGDVAAGELNKAAQHMANTAAAQYKGTVNSSGTPSNVDVRMTKAGTAAGTLAVDGKDVDIMTVNSQTYAKGDKTFWTKLGVRSTSASEIGDNWGKLDSRNAEDFQFPAPATLAQTLRQANEDQVRNSVKTTHNGVQVNKITTADGTYFVTTAEPRRVVRIEGNKSGTTYALDMTVLAGQQLEQLFQDLKAQAAKLKGVRDPNVFVSASPQVSFGSRTFSGITIKATVTPNSATSVKAIRATMSAKMNSGSKKIGGCTGTKTIKPSGSSTMTCVNRTGAWKSWFSWAKRTPGFHRYSARVNVVAYAYADTDVKAIVTKLDQERNGG